MKLVRIGPARTISAMETVVKPIPQLARAFEARGRSLYLVGGCVRDSLLSLPVSDYDCTTDAPPDEIKHLVHAAGADSVYAVGERFGTIGAIFVDQRVEITTYRTETYTAGDRKPHVEFGATLEDDLSRRDFTINAMARPALGGDLVDPYGGQADLAAGLVRAVGIPDERFREDPLRLLRGVRFVAQFSFTLEPKTRESIARNCATLQTISAERIAQEMNKILLARQPGGAVRQLCELGLMPWIVPEFLDLRKEAAGGARHKDNFSHTLMVLDRTPPVLTVRWGALLHDIAKPRVMAVEEDEVHFYGHEQMGREMASRILRRLRFDRATSDRVAHIVALSGRGNSYDGDWTDGAVRRFVREAGDALEDLFMLSRADVTSRRIERVRAAEQRVADLQARCAQLDAEADLARLRPPIDGLELMELFGREPGPWIRPIKDRLLTMVLDGDLAPDDKESAIAIARAMLEDGPQEV
ncbi:MAG: HD domain-containing protein [Chloroflexi bacterium]|nr:HD domain-containing protein [Chloroflexota bacterium]